VGGDEKRTAEGTSDEIGCVQHRGRQGSSQGAKRVKTRLQNVGGCDTIPEADPEWDGVR
jgi:hypothetical protein